MNNPNHWRGRAEEMRALAQDVADPESRRTMLKLADDYEKLAVKAEQRGRVE